MLSLAYLPIGLDYINQWTKASRKKDRRDGISFFSTNIFPMLGHDYWKLYSDDILTKVCLIIGHGRNFLKTFGKIFVSVSLESSWKTNSAFGTPTQAAFSLVMGY